MTYGDIVLEKETIKVSKLCFGSLCIGHLQSDMELNDGAEVIKRAYDSGVNFIDTAQLYGTYKYIRAAFDRYNIDKSSVVISTKTYAYTRELAEKALNEALHELGRDYIDIFMLHEQESIHTLHGHMDALEYLLEQKEAGRIKAVGISTHCVDGVLGAVEFNSENKNKNYKLDVIHPMYNMSGLGIIGTLDNMETALLKAKQSGFFIFSMKALGGGNLYSKAGEALNFVLDKPFIDSVAVGMKSVLEVNANVNFFETGKFPEEYYKLYNNTKKRLHIDDWCAGCGNCVKICPAKALEISAGNQAVCNAGKCVLCGYCSSVCRDFAIKII
ncbi:MAG: aldo/keto reductase [Oscillospiraceae bacterium]|nr:aldo/keto reductase [Oscillospiraceae bacterium]